MEFINGINEVANPLLIIIPLVMMVLSGYTVGRGISKVRKKNDHRHFFFTDLIYGNVVLNFLFIAGFIIFGLLISAAKGYFTFFTYALVILSIIGIYLILKSIISSNRSQIKLLLSSNSSMYILFGICLFLSVLVYQGIVIYYHPIFSEYDSVYLFLPISKSILLGDGLNDDFYVGSDIAIKLPPFIQAVNAWLIHSFGYSSFRLFPLYFVFLSSLLVYAFARNFTKDPFLGLIASSAFLITPALLITTSRFSLQQDLAFIFSLSASFYFFSEIIRYEKLAKTHLLMLLISLSLMSLTREIGIILSVALFFILPAIKFTQDNIRLRAFLTVLSFLPLYLLTFYDIFQNGFTNSMTIRLISLILLNCAIFYVLYHVKSQYPIKLLKPTLKFLIVLVFPLIFFINNIITIGGPFATLIFSNQFIESVALYREVFDIPSKNVQLVEALRQNLPRADIFLGSLAMGSVFVFFRLRGFVRTIEGFKNNIHFALLIILSIVMLLIWSYLLQSGFEGARIRHIAYFLPITSTLLVIGMVRNGTFYRLFYYGIIVFSTYYFLNYDLEIWNYNNHFGGFWLEPPFKDSTMKWNDFLIAGVIILALLIYESRGQHILQYFKKYNLARFSVLIFVGLLVLQLYTLYSSGLSTSSLAKMDQVPPREWEENVFEPVNYLKGEEEGKVLSLRAPAISFFTNRTNFDLYSPHTFSSIFPLLTEKNSTLFKQTISDMNIKYVVLPNEKNTLYRLVQNLKNLNMPFLRIIETDDQFEKFSMKDFDVYKFSSTIPYRINLIDQNKSWKAFGGGTQVFNFNGSLNIAVSIGLEDIIYNRAYLQTQLNSTTRTRLTLSLDYASQTITGDAIFRLEIRDKDQNVLWYSPLNNTNGITRSQMFVLPEDVLNIPLEFRSYIITDGIGRHTLTITRADVLYP